MSTIVNCWIKTGILLVFSGDEIEDATLALQDLANFETNENDELIIDLTTNLSDPTIEHEINNFNNLNNSKVLIENVFDKMQIVNIVDTDEEPSEVPAAKGLNSLKKFVDFLNNKKVMIS
ncbi:2227_t:CDS:2, partial [Cetraspora pellucida]